MSLTKDESVGGCADEEVCGVVHRSPLRASGVQRPATPHFSVPPQELFLTTQRPCARLFCNLHRTLALVILSFIKELRRFHGRTKRV
jgi:hypothetical protein